MSNVEVVIEGIGKVRLPDGCQWIARDHDGSLWAYKKQPEANVTEGYWDIPGLDVAYLLVDADTVVPDWLETLRRVAPDEVCPGCNGNGQTPEAGVAFGTPVICPDCTGSGRAEDSITASKGNTPIEVLRRMRNEWAAIASLSARKPEGEWVPVRRSDLQAWAQDWQRENDPGDDTDVVTPFDSYLLGGQKLLPVIAIAQQPAAVDEATRRDAERYRYLRRSEAWKENHISERGASAIFIGDGRRAEAKDGEALDAAIDRILAGQKP